MKVLTPLVLFMWCITLPAQDHPGKSVYKKYCVQCHGETGDGQGYAEAYVLPKPRDFTSGVFKFRSTGNQYLPIDADLIRAVKEGLPGTSMPAFDHIGDDQITQVVDYIKVFYNDRIEKDKADGFWPPKEVALGNVPSVNATMIEKGKAVYLSSGCGDCHGFAGRADGPSAPTLEDDYGNPTDPANLAQSWRFRGGNDLEDIYRAFSTGIAGTPMPTYADSISDEDRWAMAAYVQSLSTKTESNPSSQVLARKISGDLPDSLDSEAWAETEAAFFPLSAQIMWEPVNTNPTVNAVRVRALHNGEEVAILLEWDDNTYSIAQAEEEEEDDFFGEEESATVLNDGFAIQFPAGLPEGTERPYFVMGNSKYGVNLWRWTNSESLSEVPFSGAGDDPWKKYYSEYAGSASLANQLGKGRDNITDLEDALALDGAIQYKNGTYRLLVKRALTSSQSKEVQLVLGNFTPIAFWAWDGHNEEENAKGSLSAWYFLVLEKPVEQAVYYKTAAVVLVVVFLQVLAIRAARKKAVLVTQAEEAEALS